MYVAGSGLSRRWINPSNTSDPAVSASAFNSAREFSAISALPSVQTPTSTTLSSCNWRYSASEISCSSVEKPLTRRSAWRSARSGWDETSKSLSSASKSAATLALSRRSSSKSSLSRGASSFMHPAKKESNHVLKSIKPVPSKLRWNADRYLQLNGLLEDR